MGGKNSKKKEKNENKEDPETKNLKIENTIDYIASKYITQASFQELTNLHKPEYCKKLVILTSKVIQHYLNDMEIDYLDQKTHDNKIINKMAKTKIVYLDTNDLDRLDISSRVRKRRMCIGIAKFYVKIAHLFAAISMTINPQYTYTDNDGIEKTVPLSQKTNIPKQYQIKYSKLTS